MRTEREPTVGRPSARWCPPCTHLPARSRPVAPLPLVAQRQSGGPMSYVVDFVNVSTVGLESSPVADALAGLRANEARYFRNKYDLVFTTSPANEQADTIACVNRILQERDLVIGSRPLEATEFEVD